MNWAASSNSLAGVMALSLSISDDRLSSLCCSVVVEMMTVSPGFRCDAESVDDVDDEDGHDDDIETYACRISVTLIGFIRR